MAKEWTVTLNTGTVVPAFGLGTWHSEPGTGEEAAAAVELALKGGYRHIDCAAAYENEPEIGIALQRCFREGVVKREDVFITSKLWSDHHAPEDVLPACQATLKDLQLDYLDLYLIHVPFTLRKGSIFPNLSEEDKLGYVPEAMAKTWEAMEELVSKGLVKAIGISNFTITKTENLLKTANIVPAVNQVECHPYFQQEKLKHYCDKRGIVFEAYAPIGSPSRPFKERDSEPVVMEDPVIKAVAKKHNATPAQVCISFLLHQGMAVNAKSSNPKRINENLKATQVQLDTEDMSRIRGIDRGLMLFKPEMVLYQKEGVTWDQAWDLTTDADFEIK